MKNYHLLEIRKQNSRSDLYRNTRKSLFLKTGFLIISRKYGVDFMGNVLGGRRVVSVLLCVAYRINIKNVPRF